MCQRELGREREWRVEHQEVKEEIQGNEEEQEEEDLNRSIPGELTIVFQAHTLPTAIVPGSVLSSVVAK